MQCGICKRFPTQDLPFNCIQCARDAIYQPRFQHAQILLQKESLGKQIEEAVSSQSQNNGSQNLKQDQKDGNSTWVLQSAQREMAASDDRTQTILTHTESLRAEISKMEEDIASRRTHIQQRQAELDAAKLVFTRAKTAGIEPLDKGIRRMNHRWDLLHKRMAESRLFLTKEAASLAGLHHEARKKTSSGKDTYSIGGTPILDLRDLNST